MPNNKDNTTNTETHVLFSFETFKATMNFIDELAWYTDGTPEGRREWTDRVTKLMEMAAKDALRFGTVTTEVIEPEAPGDSKGVVA